MSRKKILSLALAIGVIGGVTTYGIISRFRTSTTHTIKVMEYKPSAQINQNGFQIDKYQKIESVAWINDNEVLTLTKKGDSKNPDSTQPIRYCSIYNLNTKSSKDFKDVNIDEFMGVSPDKKYVIYAEERIMPTVGSAQYEKAIDSGDNLHKNVKILNLSTGEITKLDTEKDNYVAEFVWVSNNKILINYQEKWIIIDMIGKVYAEGSKFDNVQMVAGVDDIKDLGTSVEGKFYYSGCENGKEGINLWTIDVVTKEIKTILTNESFNWAYKRGKTIIIEKDNTGKQLSAGIFRNTTYQAIIMDKSGTQLHKIKLSKDRYSKDYTLSPDGSKVAYVEYADDIEVAPNPAIDPESKVKIIDVKTGITKEIVKGSSLKDKDVNNDYTMVEVNDENGKFIKKKVRVGVSISNICWDSTSTALLFTYGASRAGNTQINTYIVSLDK
ncbi:hypothetical protein [Clostridium lacusfryxellense]|uniref:hypothetical protein n=1 Tax=Clostridium lacusfryxellense TaxID=205328 RepID=UPI001C0B61E4|nr:hypothetical protein [Clostridium lacusfryxellense]MBU3111953.1 hypothetical protein [Clostridium lacusfryxellense]